MRHIEESRRSTVVREFLNGLSFDEIAKRIGVSKVSYKL
jgi:transposase